MEEFREKLDKLILGAKKIVLTSHISPDDDAMGSLLAMYQYLSKKYGEKDIQMIYTGAPVDRYISFMGYDKVKFVSDISDNLSGCDVFIGLDGSRFDRFSNNPKKLKNIVGKKVCIDHHSTHPDDFDLMYIDSNISSNAELIYKLFYEFGDLNKEAAEVLFLGILGDTGNFAFLRADQSEVFLIAKILQDKIKSGIQDFQARYSLNSQRLFELVKILMNNTKYVEVHGWPKCMYSVLRREEILTGKFNEEEINDAKHWYVSTYLRTIKGYPWGFVISAKSDGKCGITLRSLPESVNVRSIVERIGIGGGHDRAAGGTFDITNPDKCVAFLLAWLEKNDKI